MIPALWWRWREGLFTASPDTNTILCQVLRTDPAIRGDAFDDSFTREQFAHVLFSLIFASLLQGEHDPRPVVEMARRTLYRQP